MDAAPNVETLERVLRKTSTLSIVCADGAAIECDAFLTYRACGLIRHIIELYGDTSTITLPVSRRLVDSTVRIMHGLMRPTDLETTEDVEYVLRGMDYLDTRELDRKALVDRMLTLLPREYTADTVLDIATSRAPWFLTDTSMAFRFLGSLTPWVTSFNDLAAILGEHDVSVTVLASLFYYLARMYPAVPAFRLCVSMLGTARTTSENVMHILTGYRSPAYYVNIIELHFLLKHVLSLGILESPSHELVVFCRDATDCSKTVFGNFAAVHSTDDAYVAVLVDSLDSNGDVSIDVDDFCTVRWTGLLDDITWTVDERVFQHRYTRYGARLSIVTRQSVIETVSTVHRRDIEASYPADLETSMFVDCTTTLTPQPSEEFSAFDVQYVRLELRGYIS